MNGVIIFDAVLNVETVNTFCPSMIAAGSGRAYVRHELHAHAAAAQLRSRDPTRCPQKVGTAGGTERAVVRKDSCRQREACVDWEPRENNPSRERAASSARNRFWIRLSCLRALALPECVNRQSEFNEYSLYVAVLTRSRSPQSVLQHAHACIPSFRISWS